MKERGCWPLPIKTPEGKSLGVKGQSAGRLPERGDIFNKAPTSGMMHMADILKVLSDQYPKDKVTI